MELSPPTRVPPLRGYEMSGQEFKSVATPAGLDVFRAIEQSALDAIPTGFCVCRADSGLVRYNRRAVELWGRAPPLGDPNDQHGSSFRRYSAAGEPLPFDATPVAMALRSGEPVVGAELVIERPDGSRVPVLMNATPLRDQTGRIEGAVCSFQELTEHKRAEAALRASEAELQSVINRTPFMLVRCSRDLRYRFVSEAYAQLIGRDRDEIVGKTIAEMLGAAGFRHAAPLYREGAARRAGGVRMRTRLSAEIGRRSLYIAYRPEHDATGGVDRLDRFAARHHRTERQGDAGAPAARQHRRIVRRRDRQQRPQRHHRQLEVRAPSAFRLCGRRSHRQVDHDSHPRGAAATKSRQFSERIRRGESIEHFETVRRCKDGSLVDVSLTVSPMRDQHGNIVGASKIARDITARKRKPRPLWRDARTSKPRCISSPTSSIAPHRSDDIYDAALDAIVAALHCSRASILRCDTDGMMRFAAWRGLSDRYREPSKAIRRGRARRAQSRARLFGRHRPRGPDPRRSRQPCSRKASARSPSSRSWRTAGSSANSWPITTRRANSRARTSISP